MREPEPAISRVLSMTIIHLGQPSPTASSNLPGSPFGTDGAGAPNLPCWERCASRYSPIWSCSGRGLPCRELLPVARCALTAPFHPYWTVVRRYIFCGTFRGLSPPRRYLAPCPKEPGLSSAVTRSDCLADSGSLAVYLSKLGSLNRGRTEDFGGNLGSTPIYDPYLSA